MRTLACLVGLLAFLPGAIAQSAFEAADVHASPKATNQSNPYLRGPFTGEGRYEIRSATMVDLITKAYGVDSDKVFGGPNWIEYDRFDVRAKVPSGASSDTARLMLQALLAERFKLVVKRENRPMPAYALKLGADKPKLKPADGTGNGCALSVEGMPAPNNSAGSSPMLVNNCRNMTMAVFAANLRETGLNSQFINNTPVVDQTGLEGAWDFTFKYSLPARVFLGAPAPAGQTLTLFDALDKQLGLKLELTQLPMPVVTVEGVNKTPTPNAPDVEKGIPGPPTEFEVAVLKPADPDFKGLMMNFQPGRVTLAGPLRFFIQQAWGMRDDMVFGWEKWMDSDRYNLVGKVPVSVSPGQNMPADSDTIMAMTRALLLERFNMKVHFENRPMAAYTLVAAKPKIKKADLSERTKWVEGPGPDGKDPRNASPILGRLVTVTNMTMAQLAERLQGIAPGYLSSPVLDATGLEGGYDFTISFSPNGFQNIGGGGRGGPEGPAPAGAAEPLVSDPNGGITLFEAMEKQLGLKLEKRTRPVQVLVIDHMDQKPVEN